ncbi:LAME_0E03158g1_1 [Lachancea meyersii CBS 8951]|uniref:LAME_0E03158g1_1 n=1 Tax=Lachancea meyersii CBS 8951 TaxID=1266667 RepID=A0A1G4JGI3_9SACH|nr:LAME_0E03158g1_1 [Lachancea meyersii CBS 8951]
MPFSRPKPFAMVDDQKMSSQASAEYEARRRSSSIKNALTSMIKTGSTNLSSVNGHQRPRSQSGAAPVSTSHTGFASLHSSLMSHGGSPRLLHSCDDHGVAPNELALAENTSKPVFSEDEDEEADIESGENLSEPEELHTNFSAHTLKMPANHLNGRKYLLEYLSERGFLQPKSLTSNRDISITLATSSDVVFLPTVSSQDDEYLSHLAMLNGSEPTFEETTASSRREPTSSSTAHQNSESREGVSSVSPGGPSIDADGKNVLFNLAVIVSFKRPTTVTKIKAELFSKVRIYWQHGVPPEKATNEEYYTLGELKWELTEENYSLFIPRHLSTKNKIVERTENSIKSALFKNNDDLLSQNYTKRKDSDVRLASSLDTLDKERTFKSGEYVFLLPVFFSSNIPETLYLPSGRVSYQFRCATKLSPNNFTNSDSKSDTSSSNSALSHASEDQHAEPSSHNKFAGNKLLRKVRDQFQASSGDKTIAQRNVIKADQTIQVVRMPPTISDFTADKPIYINRVWNDALSYEVSLLKKYVPAGSKIPIRIKLSPISKDTSVKRIRVSVIEKITYVSKNLEYEFDQTEAIANDPYNPYYSEFVCRRKQERILPLWEIRSKEKGCKAMKEDIVENCRSENLLSFSSVPLEGKDGSNTTDMVDPLVIDSEISFPKFTALDKRTSRTVPPYGIDEFMNAQNPSHQPQSTSSGPLPRRNSAASGVIGFFAGRRVSTPFASRRASTSSAVEPDRSTTTFKSSSNIRVSAYSRLNEPKRGLYLDCVSFKNIHVKHKLEIMLRISKRAKDSSSSEKHYEVLIDTPIIIVSDLCGSSNIELPTYDVATRMNLTDTIAPPSFEEAVSVPGSPVASPLASPIGTPNVFGSYDPDDLSINQLSLSRATTQNMSSDSSVLNMPAHPDRRYSNIDCLINASPGGSESKLFKETFEFKHSTSTPGPTPGSPSDDDEPPEYER